MLLKSFWTSHLQIMNGLEPLFYNCSGSRKGIPKGVDETHPWLVEHYTGWLVAWVIWWQAIGHKNGKQIPIYVWHTSPFTTWATALQIYCCVQTAKSTRLWSYTLGITFTLLCEVTINSICKCFVLFFYPHLRIKSKTSAYIRHLL